MPQHPEECVQASPGHHPWHVEQLHQANYAITPLSLFSLDWQNNRTHSTQWHHASPGHHPRHVQLSLCRLIQQHQAQQVLLLPVALTNSSNDAASCRNRCCRLLCVAGHCEQSSDVV
eukprot:GHRQ01032374.1.p1 GENE.GHRQ01032374.1~~GHRQ01032374.1.p1  ORF type:complete len:117 (-),score=17.87 GHRQ01032374.1:161-511(-)